MASDDRLQEIRERAAWEHLQHRVISQSRTRVTEKITETETEETRVVVHDQPSTPKPQNLRSKLMTAARWLSDLIRSFLASVLASIFS